MKPIMLIGIVLIVLGVVALAYQGITYTSREKIIDIGPIQATHETKKTIPLSPILGGVALAGGIVLVIRNWSQKISPDNLGLIKHQKRIKEGFYEKDTVSGRCSGDDGSSNTMCFGSSKVAGI